MKNLFFIFLLIFTVFSCVNENGDDIDDPDKPKPGENAEVIIETPDITMSEEGTGTTSATFTSSADWHIDLSNTKSTPSWFDVYPRSGGPGKAKIEISITEANPLYDDRNAFIIINAGNVKKAITVTQKKKDAIIASRDKVEMDPEGGEFAIELESNTSYEVYIPKEFTWLKHKKEKTKSLTLYTEFFEIEKSDEEDTREAFIVFKNKDLADTVKVFQAPKGMLTLTNNELNISYKGTDALAVELRTNIEYILEIPDSTKKWISETQPQNKSLRTDRFYLKIEPNTTYGNRTGELIIKDRNSDLSTTLRINQAQENAIILGSKDIVVISKGGKIDVELESNIEYNVVIPKDDAAWIKRVTTKSLKKDILTFDIMPNETYDDRVSKIAIVNSANKISDTITINQFSKNGLILTEKVFNLDKDFTTIDVKLQSNVNYDIIIPDSVRGWVSSVNTKALSEYTHKFQIRENTGYNDRQAKVIFNDAATNTSDTLTINQSSTKAIILSQRKLMIDGESTSIDVELKTNINYEVSIVQGSEWFSPVQTKSLSTHNLKFNAKENSSLVKRSAVAVFKDKGSTLSDTLVVEQKPKLASGVYYVDVPGTLSQMLGEKTDTITTMKLLGDINYLDLNAIRFNISNLKHIDLSDVNIENNSLPDRALYNMQKLVKVILPSNLERIESQAFNYCISLQLPVIPESVTYIGNNAFNGCTSFSGELIISGSVKEIGEYAFYGCSALKGVILKKGIEKIGARAFYNCVSLQNKLTIPSSMKEIGEYAFSECSKITGLTIEKGVEKIGSYAFMHCWGITNKLTIPGSVKEIGRSAFFQCSAIPELIIEEGVEKIGYAAFYTCTAISGKLIIPGSVKEIGESAFNSCSDLTGLTLKKGIEKIGPSAFANCKKISGTLIIPGSVKEIGQSAFYQLTGLTGLTIEKGIEKIGASAFYGCSGLENKLSIPGSVKEIESQTFRGCTELTGLIIEEGVEKIGKLAFFQCTNIVGKLIIPNSVTEIETSAFSDCNRVTELQLSSNLKTIGASAFQNWIATSLTLPASIEEIGAGAFYGWSSLRGKLVIPSKIKTIEEDVFANCVRLTDIDLPNGLTSLGGFRGCTGLTKINIPASVTTIGAYAFVGCKGLTGLTLPNSLTSIEQSAFSGCSGISGKLSLPNSIAKIESNAFSGCTGITGSLTLPSNLSIIGTGVFSYTSISEKLVIHDGITEIKSSAFSGCKNITSLSIGKNVAKIGNNAFSECTGLSGKLVIPEGVTQIDSYAFYNCTGISGVLELPSSVNTLGHSCFLRINLDALKLPWTTPIGHPGSNPVVNVSVPVHVPKSAVQLYRLSWNEAYNNEYNFVGY